VKFVDKRYQKLIIFISKNNHYEYDDLIVIGADAPKA
jgi:hypothetical protein